MDRAVMPGGTAILLGDQALPVEIRDRSGCVHAMLAWEAGHLVSAVFPVRPARPDATEAIAILGARVAHPVLGAAQRILHSVDPDASSQHIASCAAVDWALPQRIPAIDRPAALPAGTGTAIMNVLALLAQRGGVPALRYAGPYPTMALWSTLAECFRTSGDAGRFLACAEQRALAAETVEIDVDFVPAPFERVVVAPDVWAQLRDGVERVSIADRSYARGAPVRRLVAPDDTGGDGGDVAAQIWLAGAPWHELARFGPDGALRAGPHPAPVVTSPVLGQPFPRDLAEVLAELCSDGEPALLAPMMREVLTATPIAWGDAGDSDAIVVGGRIVVHAAIWDRLARRGMAELAAALVETLTPIARRLGQDLLARRVV